MPDKRPPRDPNQLAKYIVDVSTGEAEKIEPRKKDPAAVALGRKGGLKGGKARAGKLSAKERKNSARNAAEARWTQRDKA
jgi:hypothetical protein